MNTRYAKHYKKGDLIHTCRGFNQTIKSIKREDYDYDVVLTDGSSCSFVHCCSPRKTKKHIIDYFLKWGEPKNWRYAIGYWKDLDADYSVVRIVRRLRKGEEVFDRQGCLIPTNTAKS